MRMIREKIKLLRNYHGFTIAEFAQEVGVSFSTISKIEAGYIPVTKATSGKIMRRFDVLDNRFIEFCEVVSE